MTMQASCSLGCGRGDGRVSLELEREGGEEGRDAPAIQTEVTCSAALPTMGSRIKPMKALGMPKSVAKSSMAPTTASEEVKASGRARPSERGRIAPRSASLIEVERARRTVVCAERRDDGDDDEGADGGRHVHLGLLLLVVGLGLEQVVVRAQLEIEVCRSRRQECARVLEEEERGRGRTGAVAEQEDLRAGERERAQHVSKRFGQAKCAERESMDARWRCRARA